MPQKTKREKILADKHKSSSTVSYSPSFKFIASEKLPLHIAPPIHRDASEDLQLIQRDLLKTVILAGMAISFEFFLARIIR